MMTILLCTHSKTILEHWRESLADGYNDVIQINSEKGLQKCLENHNELSILLDINYFPNVSSYIESILGINSKAIILLMDDTPNYKKGKEFLALGIKAYGNSRMSSTHLNQMISVTKEGNTWLYPDFIQKLIQELTHSGKKDLTVLTSKEKLIAKHIAKGLSNKEIAMEEGICETTVKVHLRSIYKKLGVTDRLSLALFLQ